MATAAPAAPKIMGAAVAAAPALAALVAGAPPFPPLLVDAGVLPLPLLALPLVEGVAEGDPLAPLVVMAWFMLPVVVP